MPVKGQPASGLAWPHGLGSGALLFVALHEDNPLDNEIRRAIYEHVQEFPGLHLSEVARSVDVDTNHAKYHLRVLEDEGLVSSEREDGYWRFYPRADGSLGKHEILQPEDKELLSLLRREIPLRITLILLEREEANASSLGDELDIAASTVNYHTSKMEEAGLLESYRDGRKRVYRLIQPEDVRGLLLEHRPPDRLVEGFLEAWEEFEFP